MLTDRVVANASPIICLFRAEMGHLLEKLWREVLLPEAVWEEILAGPNTDPAAQSLATATWAKRMKIDRVPPQIAGWDLGPGESEVLAFALQTLRCRALVDDVEARRCARTLGIPVLGTGGILVLAKRRGLIPSVTDAIGALGETGLWISDEIILLLKRQAGE